MVHDHSLRFLLAPACKAAVVAASMSLLGACQGNIGETGTPPDDLPIADYCARIETSPGRVTIHRLNRDEYDRTVRALLFETEHPGDDLPIDDESSAGFVNDADILATGVLHVEKYDSAARELAERAVLRDEFQTRYVSCDLGTEGIDTCAAEFVRDFGLRAWRRPITDAEVARISAIIALGANDDVAAFDAGLELGIRAMLLSPNFIFRSETHAGGDRPLDGYEVASRLSYFLWGTLPDDELFDLAEAGDLVTEEGLQAQVSRMIDDDRFSGFFEGFVHRWLQTQLLGAHQPDIDAFPGFDDALRGAMKQETELFIAHIVREDLPLSTLLDADFTFLNAQLASHYGVEGVEGDEMRLVRTAEVPRGGLLTQGSILSITSHPDVTSPVKRGKWLLDRMLCSPPPDPPADVDALIDRGESDEGLSRRERLELHRAEPECASCHALMDPLGFSLEHYDPTGAWREVEDGSGEPIDDSGQLPDGTEIRGAADLAIVLADDERFAPCVTENLVSYAIGRSLERPDLCIVQQVVDRANESGSTLRGLIEGLVMNEIFREVSDIEEVSP